MESTGSAESVATTQVRYHPLLSTLLMALAWRRRMLLQEWTPEHNTALLTFMAGVQDLERQMSTFVFQRQAGILPLPFVSVDLDVFFFRLLYCVRAQCLKLLRHHTAQKTMITNNNSTRQERLAKLVADPFSFESSSTSSNNNNNTIEVTLLSSSSSSSSSPGSSTSPTPSLSSSSTPRASPAGHAVLRDWIVQNRNRPYPTMAEKRMLMTQTDLTLTQLNNWFINARRRILPTLKHTKQ